MVNPPIFRRSTVTLGKSDYAVLSQGRRSWLFAQRLIPLPSALLYAPAALSWLLRDHLRSQPRTLLAATVIPQMGCNAACNYCIQNITVGPTGVQRVKAAWMSDRVMDATVAFIESRRIALGLKGVALNIFGGEPLLNPGRCYRLLERTAHLTEATIVTNAVLLTVEVAQGLTNRGVQNMQVTFDGARDEHDRVRVLAANDGPTYDTIVANLKAIDMLDVLPHRQLRVNVTASNLAGLSGLVCDLAANLTPDRWVIYFALVDDNNVGWNNSLPPDQTVGLALANLARLAAQLGFLVPYPGGSSECGFCSEQFGEGGMVVNADGKLSSCWDTAGFPDMVVGDVFTGYKIAGNESKWVHCGYRSVNQGSVDARGDDLKELAWAIRELSVQQAA